MKDKIQFAITCGPRSEPFLELLIHSIEATESGEHDIEYLIAVNNSAVDIDHLKRIESKNPKVFFIDPPEKMYNGFSDDLSRSHGRSLTELVSSMTAKYGVLCDVDVAFLAKDWDIKITKLLDSNNIIAGSTYRKSVRTGLIYKYTNFPCVFMSIFLVEPIQKLQIDFTPSLEHVKIDSAHKLRIYGEPEHDPTGWPRDVHLDTGHELPEKIIPAGYTGTPLETVCHGFPNSVFTKTQDLGDEFLLNGEPIATHKGRSWSRGIDSTWKKKVIEWLDLRLPQRREIKKIDNESDLKSVVGFYGPDWASMYQNDFNMLNRNSKSAVRTCEAYVMYCLCRNFKCQNILEIGTGTGFSTLIFAKALIDEGVYGYRRGSVDTIDTNPDSPNIFQDNFSNIIEALPEMKSMITFYNKESADVVPFLDTEYDLAFIDGCHDYECVKADYEAVSKKVKKGGCIIFHDAVKTPSYKQGTWDVITEIKESNKKVIHLSKEIFDFFSFEEDVNDAERMKNKWKTNDYLSWAIETKHSTKELLAITFN